MKGGESEKITRNVIDGDFSSWKNFQIYIKEKIHHPGFQKYSKNTAWVFLGRIFGLALSFFVSIYMARHLGVENFGTLNFIMSFVSIAGTSFFVIDSILIKKLNHNPEEKNEILGTALIIKIINGLLTVTTATIISWIFSNNKTTVYMVMAFSTFTIFQSFSVIDSYFQAHAKVKNVSLINMVTSIVSAIVKIFIISLNGNVLYLLLSYVFDWFISAIGYIYLYKKYVGNIFHWKIKKQLFKNFIMNSWPFSVSALATSIYIRIDQVFLKYFLGSKSVGLYVVAVRFSEVWFFISGAICVSLLPAILNAHKTSYETFLSRSKKLYSLLFYSAIIICIFIFISAPSIIKVFYGSEYTPSITLMRIYVWSIIGSFISTGLQQFLLAENKLKNILLINLIGMILSISLNLIFIPIYGAIGAAFVNIVSYTLPAIIVISTKNMRDQRKALLSGILKPLSH